MRRIAGESLNVFQPRGKMAAELALASRVPDDIVRILAPLLTQERRKRIENVVLHRTRRLTVAIEGVEDPHNTAAVIRTADAFGLQMVHIVERGVPFVSSRKVTQGAHKWVDLGVWKDAQAFVAVMRQQGKKVYLAAADAATNVYDLDPNEPMALVFGNEHEGVSADLRRLADGGFAIPMYGFVDSFNISVATALAIAAVRNRITPELSLLEQAELRARFYLRAVSAGYEIVTRELGFA